MSLNILVEGTEWIIIQFDGNELTYKKRWAGNLTLREPGSNRNLSFKWWATRNGTVKSPWSITGEGAFRSAGVRATTTSMYPFSMDQRVNDGVTGFIQEWMSTRYEDPIKPETPVIPGKLKLEPVVPPVPKPMVVKAAAPKPIAVPLAPVPVSVKEVAPPEPIRARESANALVVMRLLKAMKFMVIDLKFVSTVDDVNIEAMASYTINEYELRNLVRDLEPHVETLKIFLTRVKERL